MPLCNALNELHADRPSGVAPVGEAAVEAHRFTPFVAEPGHRIRRHDAVRATAVGDDVLVRRQFGDSRI